MTNSILIEYPNFLANSMRMNEVDFESEIKISGLVKLFELGKVSTGIASKALGVSRIEFLELLGKYKVSFLNSDDLDLDYENA
jgi:predicted HTH domain antitoxin